MFTKQEKGVFYWVWMRVCECGCCVCVQQGVDPFRNALSSKNSVPLSAKWNRQEPCNNFIPYLFAVAQQRKNSYQRGSSLVCVNTQNNYHGGSNPLSTTNRWRKLRGIASRLSTFDHRSSAPSLLTKLFLDFFLHDTESATSVLLRCDECVRFLSPCKESSLKKGIESLFDYPCPCMPLFVFFLSYHPSPGLSFEAASWKLKGGCQRLPSACRCRTKNGRVHLPKWISTWRLGSGLRLIYLMGWKHRWSPGPVTRAEALPWTPSFHGLN